MTQPIPSKLFKSSLIREVPRAEFLGMASCGDPTDKQKFQSFLKLLKTSKPKPAHTVNPKVLRHLRFSIEAWLRFKKAPEKAVAILLNYKDSKGQFTIVVDQAKAEGSTPLLLSGTAEIPYYGELEYIQVRGSGYEPENGLMVEQLQVNKLAEVADKKEKSA